MLVTERRKCFFWGCADDLLFKSLVKPVSGSESDEPGRRDAETRDF